MTTNSTQHPIPEAEGTMYSDDILKTNWKQLPPNFVEKLAKVRSGTYDRTDIVARQVGVSAQSLMSVMVEAVIDNEGLLSISYGNAALAACIELAKEVESLKDRLHAAGL
jgi:hypothetical protein